MRYRVRLIIVSVWSEICKHLYIFSIPHHLQTLITIIDWISTLILVLNSKLNPNPKGHNKLFSTIQSPLHVKPLHDKLQPKSYPSINLVYTSHKANGCVVSIPHLRMITQGLSEQIYEWFHIPDMISDRKQQCDYMTFKVNHLGLERGTIMSDSLHITSIRLARVFRSWLIGTFV